MKTHKLTDNPVFEAENVNIYYKDLLNYLIQMQ